MPLTAPIPKVGGRKARATWDACRVTAVVAVWMSAPYKAVSSNRAVCGSTEAATSGCGWSSLSIHPGIYSGPAFSGA